MSTLRRTPVNFPRMKVRGARNKAKTKARERYVTVYPHVIPEQSDGFGGQTTTFTVASEYQPGALELRYEHVQDGWGRLIGRPKATIIPATPPIREPSWSLNLTVTHADPDPFNRFFKETP